MTLGHHVAWDADAVHASTHFSVHCKCSPIPMQPHLPYFIRPLSLPPIPRSFPPPSRLPPPAPPPTPPTTHGGWAQVDCVFCSVLDRLSFLLEESDQPELAASSVMLMSRTKFEDRYVNFKPWQQQRDAAQHVNLWQSGSALSVLGSLDQDCVSTSSSLDLRDITRL